MNNGWIKLHKRIRKHWLWEHPEFYQAWSDMLMMANWKDQKRVYKNDIIIIERGSFPTSLRKLAERWNFSVKKLNRLLNLLKRDTMITTHTEYGFTLVKILNYEQYQVKGEQEGTHEGTQKGNSKGTVGYTTRRSNKMVKDIKDIYISKKSQLEKIDIDALSTEFQSVDVPAEFDKWQDWMLSRGKTYKNYNSAFKNWLRSDWVVKKETKTQKLKLICPVHPKQNTITERGVIKYCPECRLIMKSESQIAMERIVA